MNYSDICNAFYKKNQCWGFKNLKTQAEIGEIFMRLALTEKSTVVLTLQPDTFRRWFSGANPPNPEVWERFREDYQEEQYVQNLMEILNENNLRDVADKLQIEIDNGKQVEKRKLATAVARQMVALANKAYEDIMATEYASDDLKVDFKDYIVKATERYNVMRLIGGQEVPLEDYFICNTLGDSQRQNGNRKSFKGTLVEDASVEKIRSIYEKRHTDNRKCLLIGSGGSGKTLMLQHLFLDAAERYPDTGMLPIFMELREFKHSDSVMTFLVDTVSQKDATFNSDVADSLLKKNRCVLLLDGLDEIDPTDIKVFQTSLEAFTDKYKDVQIIVTSRMCDAINGLHGYVPLFVWPFDNKQAGRLVDKILDAEGKPEIKEQVMEYLLNGFIGNDGVFASHPMLLTFVCRNYNSFDKFHNDHAKFYQEAYKALLSGHDKNKKPYERIFHGVDDADQFTIVFKEFCAKTFQDATFKFDSESFSTYFAQLTSYKQFKNPHKMSEEHFLQDTCSTACMLYEQDLDILYIDPGFQEFLFAEYYSTAEEDLTIELGKVLRSRRATDYNKLDAFKMLYDKAKAKIDKCIFLPILNAIFKEKYSEKDCFIQFLIEGFKTLQVSVVDEEMVNRVTSANGMSHYRYSRVENEPLNILISFMLQELDLPRTCSFTAYDKEIIKLLPDGEVLTAKLVNDPQTNEKVAVLVNNHWNDKVDEISKIKEVLNEEFTTAIDELLKFTKDKVLSVPLGYAYEIDPFDIEEEPEKYDKLLDAMMKDDNSFFKVFLGLKEFHKELRREQRRAGRL